MHTFNIKPHAPLIFLTKAEIARRLEIDPRTLTKYFELERVQADAYQDSEGQWLVLYWERRIPEIRQQLRKYKAFSDATEEPTNPEGTNES